MSGTDEHRRPQGSPHEHPPLERVGVIGVLSESGRILLIQRSARCTHPGTWCFPGGHVEEGEEPACAVVRELHEELGIRVVAEQHLGAVRVVATAYRLEVFAVRLVEGTIRPAPEEVADARFLTIEEIRALGAPMPSNADVLRLLER